MKQSVGLIFVALVLVLGFSFLLFTKTTKAPEVPLIETNKPNVVQEEKEKITYKNASTNDISVELPFPGAVVGKKFGVIGKARGYWFFEASFPIEVIDKNGNMLGSGIATALDEWMTEDFVQFAGELVVPESYIGPATLVLKKDNPSGEAQNDASVSFPITIEY